MYKQAIYDEVMNLVPLAKRASKYIWNNPEVGGTEKKSSDYMRKILADEGFKIVNHEKLPYAFYAEYGTEKPVIAILGEYDALPGLSQTVSTEKCPVNPGGPGHGCGHNLLGTAGATAAIAIKRAIEKGEVTGTVRYYGCPEEELLSGKVKMVYYGMFDGCDAAVSWHPMSANMVYEEAYLASAAAKFHFHGVSSHAAFAPERGRSALDAVELMNIGANYLREHTVDFSRIHYTTDNYGYPPNIVPDKASSWYCVRAPKLEDVKDILDRIKRIAQGAAMMTDTSVECELISGCSDFLSQPTYADLTYKNLQEADLPQFTKEELAFAKELQDTVDPMIKQRDEMLYDSEGTPMDVAVRPRELCQKSKLTASSDSGDVSRIMPTNLFTAACWPVGVAPHTWQAAAANGMGLGEKGMVYAAKVIAGTIFDLMSKPRYLIQIKKEFELQRIEYSPMYEEV